MGAFSAELAPRYGENPETGDQNPWPEKETMATIQQWCEAAFEEAEAEQKESEELSLIDTYVDYLAGRQWPGGRPSYRAKPVDNRMSRLFWELCSTLTDIRPIVDIHSAVHDKVMIDNENKVNDACKAWWRNNRTEGKVAQCIVYAILTTGAAKLEWDPSINFGAGDLSCIPLSPRSLFFLKPTVDLQSSQAVIYQDWKPAGWVQRKYPDRSHVVMPDEFASTYQVDHGPPANISPHLFQILSPAMKRVIGKNTRSTQPSAYPMTRYREFWIKDFSVNVSNRTVWVGDKSKGYGIAYQVKPEQRLYPRGRLIVMAGRQIVHDGPNPYWHGLFPFALCRLNVVPWQIYGMCYSDDTEVLTRRGWIKFSEISASDEFASRQIGTKKFEWQRAKGFTRKPYTGKMCAFTGRGVDVLVTPEHKMLATDTRATGSNRRRGNGEESVIASAFAKRGRLSRFIPQCSIWEGSEINDRIFRTPDYRSKTTVMSGDQYCAFMGMYLAEGWRNKNLVCISQLKKSKAWDQYRWMLKSILKKECGYTGTDFQISRRGLSEFCKQFGSSHEKYIPDDIMNAVPRQLDIFWKYFMLGDGRSQARTGVKGNDLKPRQSVYTVSKRLADQLVEVAQKIGISAAVKESDPPKKPVYIKGKLVKSFRKRYIVTVRYSESIGVDANMIDYDGEVFCVTVPNGFLYVRRNGKPSWCGNSDLRSWKDLQDIVNQIIAGVLDMIRRAVNPPLMAPKNSLSEGAWNQLDLSMPGSKVAFSQTAAHEPKVVSVAPLPGFVLQMLQGIYREMDQQSGIAAISEAVRKKQVPGGDTLDQIRGAQQTPLRLKGRNIEDFVHELGTQLVPNFFQFYEDERRIRIPGAPGQQSTDMAWDRKAWLSTGMQPMDLIRKYRFQIVEGSLLSIQRVEKTLALYRLRLTGDLDRKTFFDMLNRMENIYLDAEQIEKNLKKEREEGLMGMPPKGKKGAMSAATGGKGP